jgi:hypothetical protein
MKPHLPLDVERLSSKLSISLTSPTGLRWKVNHWKMKAGDIAGCVKDTGHSIVNFYGRRFHCHRVVWAIFHQRDPGLMTIDHIDRNPSNNDPANLRLATYEGQLHNTKARKSQHGRGVHKVDNRYYARLVCQGKTIALGGFATAEEAEARVAKARLDYINQRLTTLYPVH